MIESIGQIDLEQLFLVSIVTYGNSVYAEIPANFCPSVFSIGSHQAIFKLILLVIKENQTLDFSTVSQGMDMRLALEFGQIVASIPPSKYLPFSQLREAAFHLIVRAERSNNGITDAIGKNEALIGQSCGVKLDWWRGTEIYSMQFPKASDLVSNIFREKSLNFLAGEENSGKSILATNLAISVAVGLKHFLSWEINKKGCVFLLNTEMYFEDLAYRFKRMCGVDPPGDLNSIFIPRQIPPFDECWDNLNQMCSEQKPCLVVVDCLYFFHNLEENDSSDMKLLMRKLQNLRDEHNLCVLVVHHTKKGSRSESLHNDLMRGAGVFGAAADTVLMMRRSQKDDSKRIIKPTKLRHAKDEHRKARLLSLEPETLWFRDGGPVNEKDHMESESMDTAAHQVDFQEIFGGCDAMTRQEIQGACKDMGFASKTIDRCIRFAIDEGILLKVKHGVYRLQKENAVPEQLENGHLDIPS